MREKQLAEYNVTRNDVGVFDLSSDPKFYISGDDAFAFLNRLISGNIEAMRDGKVINTLFMKGNGTILTIVWLLKDEDRFIILTDAEKREVLLKWLNEHSTGYHVRIEDKSDDIGCIAVIGPKAQEVTRAIAGDDIVGLPYLGFEHNTIVDSLLCRIGYTGEYEYRFILPKERCDHFTKQIMKIGEEYGIRGCDTDVLDTLMLEMRSINQNRDLLEDTTPIQAGLHWMIDFDKDEFIGKDVVMQEVKSPRRKLLTLLFGDRAAVPDRARLFIGEKEVGIIVHKAFSPILEKDIGLAYIDERFAWVGIDFDVMTTKKEWKQARTVSSPLFITKTVKEAVQ